MPFPSDIALFSIVVSEHSNDSIREMLFDFAVAWNWLGNVCTWIAIPVVFRSVPCKHASKSFKGLYEIHPFHDTTRSSTRRAPGIAPDDKSAWRSRK